MSQEPLIDDFEAWAAGPRPSRFRRIVRFLLWPVSKFRDILGRAISRMVSDRACHTCGLRSDFFLGDCEECAAAKIQGATVEKRDSTNPAP